jgi:hypothetical protein
LEGEGKRESEREKRQERTALLFASGASVERPMWTSVAVKGGKSTTPEESGGFGVPGKDDLIDYDRFNGYYYGRN